MNTTLESIIVGALVFGAILLLFRKKIWRKNHNKNCGGGNCGC
ncbi:MAG: FeoB-associated Cys-rich membrane protein [Flavobacteriaceae bacterium]|nr:FeoB-associated Cys-rich membrane protein [Flavobacteriaceae bacterium]